MRLNSLFVAKRVALLPPTSDRVTKSRARGGSPTAPSSSSLLLCGARGCSSPASAPALRQPPIGDLRLLDAPPFLLTGARQVAGIGRTPLAASRRFARAQFQIPQLPGMQRRTHPAAASRPAAPMPKADRSADRSGA
jgi:hypothetical protein